MLYLVSIFTLASSRKIFHTALKHLHNNLKGIQENRKIMHSIGVILHIIPCAILVIWNSHYRPIICSIGEIGSQRSSSMDSQNYTHFILTRGFYTSDIFHNALKCKHTVWLPVWASLSLQDAADIKQKLSDPICRKSVAVRESRRLI